MEFSRIMALIWIFLRALLYLPGVPRRTSPDQIDIPVATLHG